MYEYRAQLVRVVDADTVDMSLDLGLSIHTETRLRVLGINAPEKSTPAGKAAKAFTEEWFAGQTGPLTVVTVKDKTEKYGRYLASIYGDNNTLASALIANGHAVAWDGKGPRP